MAVGEGADVGEVVLAEVMVVLREEEKSVKAREERKEKGRLVRRVLGGSGGGGRRRGGGGGGSDSRSRHGSRRYGFGTAVRRSRVSTRSGRGAKEDGPYSKYKSAVQ